uniref:Uncharacterized protein n=1 Tax=Odontella aurita TaxID=265563 RepID=A0A7S4MSQ4_9STRA|mmetsp:Transcript_30711/g.91970  ORF Transcript_30711/g.91970 Transcript_30711/m.91970 type:complete len:202 (+) Transcript_30711:1617-2222(+)
MVSSSLPRQSSWPNTSSCEFRNSPAAPPPRSWDGRGGAGLTRAQGRPGLVGPIGLPGEGEFFRCGRPDIPPNARGRTVGGGRTGARGARTDSARKTGTASPELTVRPPRRRRGGDGSDVPGDNKDEKSRKRIYQDDSAVFFPDAGKGEVGRSPRAETVQSITAFDGVGHLGQLGGTSQQSLKWVSGSILMCALCRQSANKI